MDLELMHPRDSMEDLLMAGGFKFTDYKPDWENKIVKIFKNRKFNGVNYTRIEVSINPRKNVWDELTVRIGS
jgi:hypothetical protein